MVQDGLLTGYAAGSPAALGLSGTQSLLTAIGEMTYLPDSIRASFAAQWSDPRLVDPSLLVRRVVETPMMFRRAWSRQPAVSALLSATQPTICVAERSDEIRARERLLTMAIDARARGINVMMADTAGRLPTQLHLMDELKKVKRVIGKAFEGAPHEVLLVIDANTGQNALTQVKAFDDALGLTGLIVTKLDGTAKGGILAAIARQRPVPVYFIGVGEKVEDLQPFNAEEFTDALLGN